MARKTVQNCKTDCKRLGSLGVCMETYGIGDPGAEWPHNCISRKTVAYSCGALARAGKPVEHNHDPAELERCRRLATLAARTMKDTEVGMGLEATDFFRPFFISANVEAKVPRRLSEPLIRTAFGGTIYPPAKVRIEALRERGRWWSAVTDYYRESPPEEMDECLAPWRAMIEWFHGQPELHGAAFAMIGEDPLDAEFKNAGCVYPRLALGITDGGSLVGICGSVVHT
jgi:hypothetical protein